MPIYQKSVRALMWDMATEMALKKGQVLPKAQVVAWFGEHYPKIKQGTIGAHMIRLSTNARTRIHYKAKPTEDDLFFQIDGSRFRLYDSEKDPPPIYEKLQGAPKSEDDKDNEEVPKLGSLFSQVVGATAKESEFAYESDLRNFISKNLGTVEPGLLLYEEEGINGVEFPAGGRLIDILAIDSRNNYVVIELKVSKGYDRAVGQLLRYVGWIAKNHAESTQGVRGIIIAREITEDLLLACSRQPDVELFEYQLSVSVRQVEK